MSRRKKESEDFDLQTRMSEKARKRLLFQCQRITREEGWPCKPKRIVTEYIMQGGPVLPPHPDERKQLATIGNLAKLHTKLGAVAYKRLQQESEKRQREGRDSSFGCILNELFLHGGKGLPPHPDEGIVAKPERKVTALARRARAS